MISEKQKWRCCSKIRSTLKKNKGTEQRKKNRGSYKRKTGGGWNVHFSLDNDSFLTSWAEGFSLTPSFLVASLIDVIVFRSQLLRGDCISVVMLVSWWLRSCVRHSASTRANFVCASSNSNSRTCQTYYSLIFTVTNSDVRLKLINLLLKLRLDWSGQF